MTKDEFRRTLERLGLSQARAARLLGITKRSVEHWANEERAVSPTAARFLALFGVLREQGWSQEDIEGAISEWLKGSS